jgi:tRNA C32,U32 (ribose-2'-O)-methylase TrmJ
VQHLIKQLAEERGFRAMVEEQVPDGSVDVGLHRDELSIACEISITSTPDYEVQNLAKCVAAGFSRVWAIAPDQKRQRAVQKAAMADLSADQLARVAFLTTEEMVVAFDEFAPIEATQSTVRGYKVSVSRKVISPAEALERKAAVSRIMAKSMRETD